MKFPWTLFALSLVPMMSLVGRDESDSDRAVEPSAVGEASVEEPEPEPAELPCDTEVDATCAREDVPAEVDPSVIAYGSSS